MAGMGRIQTGRGKRLFSVSFTGQEKLAKNAQMLRNKFPEFLADANMETAEQIFAEARRNLKVHDAIVTGDLYDSIEVTVTARGLAIYVGSTSHYAPYVEFGTRPHFPPLEPIRQWCIARGIPEEAAFPICVKISQVGTPEQPFLYPALLAGKRNHLERIRKLISLGVKNLLGRAA